MRISTAAPPSRWRARRTQCANDSTPQGYLLKYFQASPTTGEGARTSAMSGGILDTAPMAAVARAAHVSECVLKVSADVPHYFGDFRGPGDGGREQAVSGEEER
jgi:hypothetical protein